MLEKITESDQKANWELKLLKGFMEHLDGVKHRLKDAQVPEGDHPVKCVYSLESAVECLQGLVEVPATEAYVTALMEVVLNLIMCRRVSLNFPKDVFGNPDFADAWAASIAYIDYSTVLSAYSVLKLRDPATCLYSDPVSGKHTNSVLIIMAHPNDQQLTEIYKCLSAFPSLQGLIQSNLVSGSFKVFPSIVFGLQASSFWYLLRTQHDGVKFTNSEWEVVRCLVWSLQNSIQTPAAEVVNSIKAGKALNPVDNITKILTACICFLKETQSQNNKQKMF